MRFPPEPEMENLAGRWWVAHTKSRNEKALAWDLLGRQIAYFLPLVEHVRFSGGRKRQVQLPLFPSYVFVCGKEEDRYAAFATRRVCKTLEVVDQQRLTSQLGAIETALQKGALLELCPLLQVGSRCRVTGGPFEGLEGAIVRYKNRARVVLEVGEINLGACLEIDSSLIELCPSAVSPQQVSTV